MSNESHASFSADLESVPLARRFAVDAVDHDLDEFDSYSVELVTTELVTNAIVHARTDVKLTVGADGTVVSIEVADDSDTMPVARVADQEATSGRGVALVEALSAGWGARSTPGDGKVVWCQLDTGARPEQ